MLSTTSPVSQARLSGEAASWITSIAAGRRAAPTTAYAFACGRGMSAIRTPSGTNRRTFRPVVPRAAYSASGAGPIRETSQFAVPKVGGNNSRPGVRVAAMVAPKLITSSQATGTLVPSRRARDRQSAVASSAESASPGRNPGYQRGEGFRADHAQPDRALTRIDASVSTTRVTSASVIPGQIGRETTRSYSFVATGWSSARLPHRRR